MHVAALAEKNFLLKLKQTLLHTLKKRAEFLACQASGNFLATKTITIQYLANPESCARFGFTVSKRISKLAVERNKIKRRLRAIARELICNKRNLLGNYDYVIIARSSALEREFALLKGDVEYALKKILKNEAEKNSI